MMHGSLFSGIGGFDLAAEWMGWGNAFHCEWDDFGTKVLNYYWPNAKSYGDITKTDFMEWRGRIDILTGGFPCQPFSMAGKRKGKDDDRYLWPEMLRAIREIQPTWVIGENVGGIISMVQPCDEVEVGCQASLLEEDYFTQKDQEYVVETVCSDLEREGYSVQPFLIPACAIGAPHRRDRVWFVAKNTKCDGLLQREPEQERAKNGQLGNIGAGGGNGIYKQKDGGATADTKRIRLEHNMERGCETEMFGEEGRGGQDCIPAKIQRIKATGERWSTPDTGLLGQKERQEQPMGVEQLCEEQNAPDTDSDGLNKRNGQYEKHTDQGGEYALNDVEQDAAPDTESQQRERVWFVAYSDLYANRNIRKQDRKTDSLQGINREEICAREFVGTNTGNNTNANNTGLQGSQKQGSINKSRTNGNKQFTRLFQPNWEKFPTQSPVCGRDDGLSDMLVGISFPKWRTESIKAYGNAIVPQVAYEIFKAINKYEQNYGQD